MKKKIFILPLMAFMFMSAFAASSVGANPSAVHAHCEHSRAIGTAVIDCPDCEGTGRDAGTGCICDGTGECHFCEGTGGCWNCNYTGKCQECFGMSSECVYCGGTGRCKHCDGQNICDFCHGSAECTICNPCTTCDGTGMVVREISTYTIVGDSALMGSDWDETDTDNDMTDMGSGHLKLVKENVTLSAGDYEYKMVANHEWGIRDFPAYGNQTLSIEHNGTYTITFEGDTTELNASYVEVFASLEELVTKLPATSFKENVIVTITDAVIDDFYVSSKGYTNGIYVTAANTTVEIYCNDVPDTWEVGGKVSGTIQAEWLLYNGTSELQKWTGGWSAFTYTAPAATTPIEIVIDKLALAQDFGTFYAFELIDNETNFSFRFVIYYSGSFEFGKTYTFADMDQINSDLYLVGEIGRYAKYSACDFVATLDNDVITSIEANVTLTTGVVYHLTYTAPVSWPEDAPTEAPAAPTYDGASLLGAPLTTNLEFEPLDWPGSMPEKLTFETGETIYFIDQMNWQIYTNWAEDSYDMSEYDMLHVDLFPSTGTEIKVTFEGLGDSDGGQGYKNSVVKTLTAGEWNGLDIALSEFPGLFSGDAYDFSDIKYLILEDYDADQTALSVGNVYFYKTPHEHAIKTTHTKVEAKCLEAGHEAHYECDCGEYFSDQALTQEIENLETWLSENGDGYIAPIGHDIKKVNGIPATEGTDGFKDAYKCKNCGKYFEDKAGTILIGGKAAYNAWKLAEGKIPALEPQKENGLSGGAIAGIVIGSVFGLLIIAFAVLYILWKRKNLNVPILSKVLTPAFRFINKLFFKTKLNDVEAKEAENKSMKE